jgi:hypothetical protein
MLDWLIVIPYKVLFNKLKKLYIKDSDLWILVYL